ncbi:tripartite tricarboxylate transporter substrate-binding protein [Muricoccus radiodurans]|uniref:tripartite tricarboxylate transporter substrate-binding protein n=1 Tax=Muricoccus radiodurans TaxID=2231721 RepID=UPI003CF5F805
MTPPLPGRRAALGLGTALLAGPALAQGPSRTLRAIVGFPPGGTSDIVARLLVERMRAGGAGQAIVDNRPGAGGRLALQNLKGSAPDGTAFVQTPASMLTIYPHLYPRTLGYDPIADFTPVSPVCIFPFGFAVRTDHPARDLAGYIAWAKARPNGADFASPVPGSMPHFIGTQLARSAGITLNHVPYRGSAPAMQDLLSGTISATLLPIGESMPHHRAGAMRILAVTSPQRMPNVPDIPTMAESGHPDLTHEEWYGVFLPARAPEAVVAALHQSVVSAVGTPEMREALARIELAPLTLSPADFAARLRRERDAWGPIVSASGFVPED